MKIHDFYSKLTSVTEESGLFQALRTLSQSRIRSRFSSADGRYRVARWAAWPAMAGDRGRPRAVDRLCPVLVIGGKSNEILALILVVPAAPGA